MATMTKRAKAEKDLAKATENVERLLRLPEVTDEELDRAHAGQLAAQDALDALDKADGVRGALRAKAANLRAERQRAAKLEAADDAVQTWMASPENLKYIVTGFGITTEIFIGRAADGMQAAFCREGLRRVTEVMSRYRVDFIGHLRAKAMGDPLDAEDADRLDTKRLYAQLADELREVTRVGLLNMTMP